ncbi:hypothetical protein THSYN_11285 [Candidatus Thiodictyon syntrophicum]|uniref:Uncharacterized protein n=2 Tax=Candidatus Thiodictyon syntrophicum TaxID=1166950 RepID=A0A2K8U7V2_9GAMM|nr:hypothetical protein THSYN_11285 [Candidatus Thiodictyon syntrophicum]
MQATKLLLTTDNAGRIQEIPPLPPNARLEAIFLVIEQGESPSAKRKPSPRIVGLGAIHDDPIAPVAAADEWEAKP